MAPRRTALALVGAALALAPAVSTAAFPVAIYPLRLPGLRPSQRQEVHAVLEAGLANAGRRGVLSPRSPALLRATCEDPPTAACLGELAKGGLVLAGRGELRSGMVIVTAALWDSRGLRSREVRFAVDLVIQNVRPVNEALFELELEIEPDGKVARGRAPSPARESSGPPAPAPPALAAAPPSPAPAAPLRAAAAPQRPTSPMGSGLWKRRAGPWLTGIGAALLAGGAAAGFLNRDLADELDAKYARGTLGPEDRSSYDRVKQLNVLSTALFAAGGAASAAGAWFWITAPAAPGNVAMVGAEGRF